MMKIVGHWSMFGEMEKLSRIELDVANTPANVTEMFYSSLYRSFLTPVSKVTLPNYGKGTYKVKLVE